MDTLTLTGALLIGVLVRIAVPVAVTAMLVYVFTRLDAHWKAEAEIRQQEPQAARLLARNAGCWEIHGCSEEKRKNCKAYNNKDVPCWQVHRKKDGTLQEKCFGCDIFKKAPMPVPV